MTSTFSFRAECLHDVKIFEILINGESNDFRYSQFIKDNQLPDVYCEFECSLEIDKIKHLMSKIDDSHVMMETLRKSPLKDNDLTRNRSNNTGNR